VDPDTRHADASSSEGSRPLGTGEEPGQTGSSSAGWRWHYRGAYSDRYLDGDLDAERLSVWTERLGRPDPRLCTLVAVEGTALAGFVHLVFDAHPDRGVLVDNLHVAQVYPGRGLGTRLVATAAGIVLDRRPGSAVHLWVLEQNKSAQAFYRSRSGGYSGRELVAPPAGDPRNPVGRPAKLLVVWTDRPPCSETVTRRPGDRAPVGRWCGGTWARPRP
jgi:ribosomal protein S18 acetylase RimI-like enzyme